MENKELTSADIFAMFAETKQLMDKLTAETDRKFAETKQLFDKLGIKADNINTKVEGISKSSGLFAEEYFFNSLAKKKDFAGIHFNDISYGDVFKREVDMPDGNTLKDQFDIVMRNGKSVAIIEVKCKAESKYVKELAIRKVKNFRILYPEYKSFNIYLGLGSLFFNKNVVDEAKKYGIVLLKQVGDIIEYKADWAVKAY